MYLLFKFCYTARYGDVMWSNITVMVMVKVYEAIFYYISRNIDRDRYSLFPPFRRAHNIYKYFKCMILKNNINIYRWHELRHTWHLNIANVYYLQVLVFPKMLGIAVQPCIRTDNYKWGNMLYNETIIWI